MIRESTAESFLSLISIYVKIGAFSRDISKKIDTCYRLREKADYDDFFLVAKEDALQQFEKAKHVVHAVEQYISTKQDV